MLHMYIYIYTNETKKKIQMITQTQKTQEITVLHIYKTIYWLNLSLKFN